MTTPAGPPALVVSVLGVPVGIPAAGSAVARLRHQWSRALTDEPAAAVVDLTGLGDDELAHDYALTSRVTMVALEATAGRRINLHAGAVADAAGRAIAVIGASGSGKTTAIGLLATRLGYLSDETTSFDDTLTVHAHPKPLSVITDRDAPHRKQSVSPDDLGLLPPPASARLHRIVLLHRGDDDSGLVPITPAHAIAAMVPQSSSLALLEHPILRLAETIDACGGAWGLHYHELADWLDDLVLLLDASPQAPAPRVHHPSSPLAPAPPGTWSRAAWHDAVEYDDELVLMVGDRVQVLAGLGVLLWLALETPQGLDDLVARAQALAGEHPDAPALVADALATLAEEGVVVAPA
ncbi:hypothetical protein [Nocardioides sp. Soil774]|uniref:hypothetical protein n=1 Tax=Nocardioides sp. Soil774 TaxID=1736408 RepID=UPI0012F7CE4B|nr:hypothetical protein [Nocardioides sp. Soil774]